MIKQLTQKSFVLQIFITIIVFCALWYTSFLCPEAALSSNLQGPLYSDIVKLFSAPLFSVITALVLVLLQAFIINLFYIKSRLIQNNSFFPSLLIVVLYSWNVKFLTVHPVLLANFFLMFGTYYFLNISSKKDSLQTTLIGAFLMSIASLIYLPYIYFYFACFIILVEHRVSTWREYIIVSIGFVLPYLYYFTFLFLVGDTTILLEYLSLIFNFGINISDTYTTNIAGIVVVLLALVSLFVVLNNMYDKVIRTKIKSRIIITLFITSLIFSFLCNIPVAEVIFVLLHSVVYLTNMALSFKKKTLAFEVFVVVCLLMIIVLRIWNSFFGLTA
ncbi:MAG: hypothetical protein PHP31_01475 [Lentimicrobiaceae bacterium]|nr:hypothetical protein [Lentimicrobiaceae bacterium]